MKKNLIYVIFIAFILIVVFYNVKVHISDDKFFINEHIEIYKNEIPFKGIVVYDEEYTILPAKHTFELKEFDFRIPKDETIGSIQKNPNYDYELENKKIKSYYEKEKEILEKDIDEINLLKNNNLINNFIVDENEDSKIDYKNFTNEIYQNISNEKYGENNLFNNYNILLSKLKENDNVLKNTLGSRIMAINNKIEDSNNLLLNINNNLVSNSTGIFYSFLDGYEGELTFENIDIYTYDDLKYLTNESKKLKTGYKIINNLNYYINILLDKNIKTEDDIINKNIYLNLNETDGEIKGKVKSITYTKNGTVISVYCDNGFELLNGNRVLNGNLSTIQESSFKIPSESTIKKYNLDGVYVKNDKSIVEFIPINILKSTDSNKWVKKEIIDNVEINGKIYNYLNINDKIIINPSSIKEGELIN